MISEGLSGFLTVSHEQRPMMRSLQADDFVVALVDRLLTDAVAGAAVLLGDDDVLRGVDRACG